MDGWRQSLNQATMGDEDGVDSRSRGGEIVSGVSPLDVLPEDCISNIISFTSPRDACVVASVSKTFESAVKSDIVWERFLPVEYASMITPSRVFSSKKELYFALCDEPVLIDDGKKSFSLEKSSGKRCIMLSAMDISIIWGDTPRYWRWIPLPEARFERVAELIHVCWFEIRGKMNTRILSPNTRYSAYIVFKIADRCHGLDEIPMEAGIGVVGHGDSKKLICFETARTDEQYLRRERSRRNDLVKPEEREDGWMEVELGDFFNGDDAHEIEMSVLETKLLHWKSGLIIQGIEIRPAKFR